MIKIQKNNLISYLLGTLFVIAIIFGSVLPAPVSAYTVNGDYVGNADYLLRNSQGGGTDFNNNNNCNYYNNYCNNNYNYNTCNISPVIYNLYPNATTVNYNNLSVALTGTNFFPNSVARFNGSSRTTSFTSQTQLTMILNASDLSNPGTYTITISNSTPCANVSNGLYFKVNPPVAYIAPTPMVAGASITKTPSKVVAKKAVTPVKEVPCVPAATDNGQSANALFGANGFMPSNLIQWIVFGILILLAVILWRKAYLNDHDKNKPLKHS